MKHLAYCAGLSLLLGAGSVCAGSNAQGQHGKTVHWGYHGAHAAEYWGELDPAYKTCMSGKAQSPIDIRLSKKNGQLKPIDFAYVGSSAQVVNNGHTVQINLANAGAIKLDGTTFKLLQFHFHTPSEEQFDGKHYPMVAHLVHKSDQGELAVVGVMLTLGKENAALKSVFDLLPKVAAAGDKAALDGAFDVAAMLPADKAYYAFKGSLTTPPCSEGVRWQIMKTPIEMSSMQFAAFRSIYAFNARPVQLLHGRLIHESK